MSGTTPALKEQRIISLTSENIKRIQIAQITPNPDGSLVVIGGMNGEGKSSLLDSIEMAIGGKDAIPERPIRDGASKARIILETDDLKVQRTFTATGTQLVVTNKADGSKISSPQALLDSLTNSVAFDPLSFLRMKDDKQAESLRKLVGIDFTELNKEYEAKYNERTGVNRQVKTQQAKVDNLPRHSGLPKEAPTTFDVLTKLEAAEEQNRKNDKMREELSDVNDAIDQKQAEIQDRIRQIEELEKQLAAAQKELKEKEAFRDRSYEVVKALEDIDIAPIREEIQNVEQVAAKLRDNAEWQKAHQELSALSKESEALTEGLKAIEEEKEKQLAAAKFPIEGLSFTSEGITYQGIPFKQVNTANQLRVSVAIAFAMQPKLKVAIIRDGGNDLDNKNLALLAQFVAEHGGQCWLERVGEGQECTVILEAGEVKEDRTGQTV